jgi:hypothetical protein
MANENDSQAREAAEVLLAVAVAERDDAQARVDWLTAMVARYRGGGATTNGSHNVETVASVEPGDDDDDEGGRLYNKVRPAVLKVFQDALPRKLTMADATLRFERLGITINAKTATSSVRHAVKALIKQGKLKKIGTFHYKAVAPTEN